MEVGTSQGNQKILPERSYRKRDRKNQRNHAKQSEKKTFGTQTSVHYSIKARGRH